jgi:hypothetical protein
MDYKSFTDKQIEVASKQVVEIHQQGYHCSESLIRALWPVILPDEELSPNILKMVMPLRGGIASTMSSHCGGLTIGIVMIGAVYGRVDNKSGDQRLAPAICRMYWKTFLDEFRTSNCTLLRIGEPGPEAPSRCGCIMARSTKMVLQLLNKLNDEKPDIEKIYTFKLDRSKEPCHERVMPINPKEF